MQIMFKLKPEIRPPIWLLFAIAVSLNACGSSAEKWGEEVQLSDGKTIVVEREIILEHGGDEWAHNLSGQKPREYRIRFAAPDGTGQTIEWKSIKKSPNGWPEHALVLDVESGQAIVFAIVYITGGCEVYVKYRYQDGAWVEHALSEEFEQRSTNLFIRAGTNMPKFVTLPEKLKKNKEPNYRPSLRNVGPRRKVCG